MWNFLGIHFIGKPWKDTSVVAFTIQIFRICIQDLLKRFHVELHEILSDEYCGSLIFVLCVCIRHNDPSSVALSVLLSGTFTNCWFLYCFPILWWIRDRRKCGRLSRFLYSCSWYVWWSRINHHQHLFQVLFGSLTIQCLQAFLLLLLPEFRIRWSHMHPSYVLVTISVTFEVRAYT